MIWRMVNCSWCQFRFQRKEVMHMLSVQFNTFKNDTLTATRLYLYAVTSKGCYAVSPKPVFPH